MSRTSSFVASGLLAAALAACSTAPAPRPGAVPPGPPEPSAREAPPPVTATPPAPDPATVAAAPSSRDTGLAIYQDFRAGLAEPQCGNAQARWRKHFAHAPRRVGDPATDTLPLFGYVVQALREAGLPTEFALIPFIESGYAPGARSKAGPAGLWQFIAITARSHGVRVEAGYDGRLSPAESTRAAASYLKSLHDRFDGNWRLTAMAYNAGEYRVLRALNGSGGNAAEATPASIKGLPAVTYAYVEKLHALACLLEEAGEQPQWRAALEAPVPRLHAVPLDDARSLEAWAKRNDQDAATLRRLNPALAGHWPSRGAPWALVPGTGQGLPAAQAPDPGADVGTPDGPVRSHTVRKGESAWSIAKRYGVPTRRLLDLNGLKADSVLRPGMVLRLQ